MRPLPHRHSGGVDLLLSGTAARGCNPKTQGIADRRRRQEHILCGIVPEIKDTLPCIASVPIDPGGKREISIFANMRRKHQIIVCAIQNKNFSFPLCCQLWRPINQGIIAIARTVPEILIKVIDGIGASSGTGNFLQVADRRYLVTIDSTGIGRPAIIPFHTPDVLNPVINRISLHPGCTVEHINHRTNGCSLLSIRRIAASGPVGAVIPFRHPDRPAGVVMDFFKEIVHLCCRAAGIGRIVAPVVMHRHKIDPQISGVRLLNKRIQPTAPPTVCRGRRSHTQACTKQIRP